MSSTDRINSSSDAPEAISEAIDQLLNVAEGMAITEDSDAWKLQPTIRAAARERLLRRYSEVGAPVGTSLGVRLKASGVSVGLLARIAGMPVAVIQQAEIDASRVKARTRSKIAAAFNDVVDPDSKVTIDELFPPMTSS